MVVLVKRAAKRLDLPKCTDNAPKQRLEHKAGVAEAGALDQVAQALHSNVLQMNYINASANNVFRGRKMVARKTE